MSPYYAILNSRVAAGLASKECLKKNRVKSAAVMKFAAWFCENAADEMG
jgi:hypothetical protein